MLFISTICFHTYKKLCSKRLVSNQYQSNITTNCLKPTEKSHNLTYLSGGCKNKSIIGQAPTARALCITRCAFSHYLGTQPLKGETRSRLNYMGTTSCDFCGQYYSYIYPCVHVTQDESSNTYERQYLPSVHRSGLYNECRLQTIDERC